MNLFYLIGRGIPLLLTFFLVLTLVSASNFGIDDKNIAPTPQMISHIKLTEGAFDNNTETVNSSNFWGNYYFGNYPMDIIKLFAYNQTQPAIDYILGLNYWNDSNTPPKNVTFNNVNVSNNLTLWDSEIIEGRNNSWTYYDFARGINFINIYPMSRSAAQESDFFSNPETLTLIPLTGTFRAELTALDGIVLQDPLGYLFESNDFYGMFVKVSIPKITSTDTYGSIYFQSNQFWDTGISFKCYAWNASSLTWIQFGGTGSGVTMQNINGIFNDASDFINSNYNIWFMCKIVNTAAGNDERNSYDYLKVGWNTTKTTYQGDRLKGNLEIGGDLKLDGGIVPNDLLPNDFTSYCGSKRNRWIGVTGNIVNAYKQLDVGSQAYGVTGNPVNIKLDDFLDALPSDKGFDYQYDYRNLQANNPSLENLFVTNDISLGVGNLGTDTYDYTQYEFMGNYQGDPLSSFSGIDTGKNVKLEQDIYATETQSWDTNQNYFINLDLASEVISSRETDANANINKVQLYIHRGNVRQEGAGTLTNTGYDLGFVSELSSQLMSNAKLYTDTNRNYWMVYNDTTTALEMIFPSINVETNLTAVNLYANNLCYRNGTGCNNTFNNLTVIGNINVTGNLIVGGNETVLGNVTVNKNLAVGGNETVKGNINISNNLIVGGNMSVKRPYWVGYDNSTQLFVNTANAQVINISNNNDIDNYGIYVVNKQNLTFDVTGDYICTLSPEFFQNSGGTALVTFWIQKNGVDVKWSNSRFSIANNQYNAPSITYQFDITNPATDNIRFMWWSDNTGTQLYSSGVLTSPSRPSIPAVLLNCFKVSEITS